MKIKKRFKLFNAIMWTWFIFWIAETSYFLIVDGWHWKAISPEEKLCDSIVSILFIVAGMLLGSMTYSLLSLFANAKDIVIDEPYEP